MEVDPHSAARMIRCGVWRVIDCREADEHMVCRLEGAELVPLSEWDRHFPDAFPARDENILVYCHHGFRSLRATHFLQSRGYAGARSLRGGIDAWALETDPAMPRYELEPAAA